MMAVSLLCSLVFASSALGSTLSLISGGRVLPDEFSPIFADNGFWVPVDLVTVFGGHTHVGPEGLIVAHSSRQTPVSLGDGKDALGALEAKLFGDAVYVPLRSLADMLGLRLSWDLARNTLELTSWSALGDSGDRAASPSVGVMLQPPPAPSSASSQPSASFGGHAASLIFGPPPPIVGGAAGDAGASLLSPRDIEEPQVTIWEALRRETGLELGRFREDGRTVYTFGGEGELRLQTSRLIEPDRVVVDIPDVHGPSVPLEAWADDGNPVERVRASAFDSGLRIVFDLAVGVGHRLDDGSGDQKALRFHQALTAVDVVPGETGGRIHLDVSGETPYEVTKLTEPDRVVIDLFDTTLIGGSIEIPSSRGPLARLRAAQFQSDVARIVLDLRGSADVELGGTDALSIVYGDQAGILAFRSRGDREAHIGIKGNHDVSVHYLRQPDRVVIDVPGLVLAYPPQELIFPSGPVFRVRASQYTADAVRIVADLRRYVQHATFRDGDRTVVQLIQPTLEGRTITVDAGHGGVQPGAVSPRLGLEEKAVNLHIARRLQELLLQAEADVVMTRVDDSFVYLLDRPKISNEAKADIFVSIHANTALIPTESARGTEVFFQGWRQGRESEDLAKAVQAALVSALGTVDRGIKGDRSFSVLTGSEMPAILVEVAFLSHPDEEALLSEPWFRERAAEGIFNGLLKYFHPNERAEPLLRDDSAGPDEPWHSLDEIDVGLAEVQ